MPRLAIVIDAVGSIESLEGTLVSVLENRPPDCEILVALDSPYADPYELGDEVRFVQSARRARWSDCINEALAAARAPFVHLLASGATVNEGWTEPALACFGNPQVAAVAPLIMDAARPDRILAAGLAYDRSGRHLPLGGGETQLAQEARQRLIGPCAQAAFYRRAALEMIGGFSSELGAAQADVDAALALAKAGFTTALASTSRVLAAGTAAAAQGALRRGLCEERLFWRNLPKAGVAGALLAHAALVALELIRGLPRPRAIAQLAGRALACCQVGSYVRRSVVLRELGARAARQRPGNEQLRIDRSHKAPVLPGADQRQVRSG